MTTVWEYTVWDAFLSMLWFFLFFIWIWLLIAVFSDIFRSDDLSGWGKAPLDGLRDRAAVPRRVRVPDRARQEDGRARGARTRSATRRRRCARTSRASTGSATSTADEIEKLARAAEQRRDHR